MLTEIYKRTNRRIIFFIIFYQLFLGFIQKNFELEIPLAKFVIDFLLIALLFRHPFLYMSEANFKWTKSLYLLLFLSFAVGGIINAVSPFNFFWGFRSEMMGVLIMFATASYLRPEDIRTLFKYFFYFQFLNFVCAAYQYHVLGYFQDFNNGAFTGGAGQDIFCGALMVYYFYEYINKRCEKWKVVFVFLSVLYIAVVEEEKFIIMEMMLLMFYYTLSSKLNFVKILLLVIGGGVMIFAIGELGEINGGDHAETLLSPDKMLEYAQMQGAGYELPRIGSSAIIGKLFFSDPLQYFFGLGLGVCEDSSLSIVNTSFFNRYGELHYMWFPFQIIFMQTGWIGIVLFVTVYVKLVIVNIKEKRNCSDQFTHVYDFGIVITLLCIVYIWYNGTMHNYSSIMPHLFMGLAPALTRFLNRKEE